MTPRYTGLGKAPEGWGKDRECPTCGGKVPFAAVNENGVAGWNRCQLHKAAPILLAALEKIAEVCNGYGDEAGWAHRYARAAIAKMEEQS